MAEWFRHDVDARNDIKMRKLARTDGLAGIGAFWVVAEVLFEHGGMAPVQEVVDELDYLGGAEILDRLHDLNLVEIKDGTVTSHRVKEEIQIQEGFRQKKVEAGRMGGLAKASNAKQMLDDAKQCSSKTKQSLAEPSTLPNPTLPIKKDISVSDDTSISKEKKGRSFVKPTVEQVRSYCNERNNSVDADTFFNFYESKGWKIGIAPMKDWKACVRTWERSRSQGATDRRRMVTDREERSRSVNPDGTLNLLG